MAFEGLSEKLSAAFKKLRGKGRLSEADVKEAMREIRLALLEADVSYKVVKQFIAQVTERAVGSDVLEALSPCLLYTSSASARSGGRASQRWTSPPRSPGALTRTAGSPSAIGQADASPSLLWMDSVPAPPESAKRSNRSGRSGGTCPSVTSRVSPNRFSQRAKPGP